MFKLHSQDQCQHVEIGTNGLVFYALTISNALHLAKLFYLYPDK